MDKNISLIIKKKIKNSNSDSKSNFFANENFEDFESEFIPKDTLTPIYNIPYLNNIFMQILKKYKLLLIIIILFVIYFYT
jgi:hypothetical protein